MSGPSSSTEPRKCECQPRCGRALSGQDEPKHEQVIFACGHIGCNFYQAGKCIVCESDIPKSAMLAISLHLLPVLAKKGDVEPELALIGDTPRVRSSLRPKSK